MLGCEIGELRRVAKQQHTGAHREHRRTRPEGVTHESGLRPSDQAHRVEQHGAHVKLARVQADVPRCHDVFVAQWDVAPVEVEHVHRAGRGGVERRADGCAGLGHDGRSAHQRDLHRSLTFHRTRVATAYRAKIGGIRYRWVDWRGLQMSLTLECLVGLR